MTAEQTANHWIFWVNWADHQLSYEPLDGFEAVTFCSEETCQTNLRLLLESGFHFCEEAP